MNLVEVSNATGISGVPEEIAAHLRGSFGLGTAALLLYGSRARGSTKNPTSEYDVFVIVDDYADAIRELVTHTTQPFSTTLATLLSRALPPTIVRVTCPTQHGKVNAKCIVLSTADFERATSRAAKDHFVKGRLFQHVITIWTRDAGALLAVDCALKNCRRAVINWAAPYLSPDFDAAQLFRKGVEVSFAAELRPETSRRVEELVAAQQERMIPLYTQLLNESSEVQHDDKGSFRFVNPPTHADATAIARYLRRSKRRQIARIPKSMLLYSGWPDYLRNKFARHRKVDENILQRGGSILVGMHVRNWFVQAIRPIEQLLIAARVTPTQLNIAGAVAGLIAGVAIAFGNLAVGGVVLLLGGICDVLDGRIARKLKIVSPHGAFLDSTLDRFSEVFLLSGFAFFFRFDPAALIFAVSALGASMLVSYTRARGEALGVSSVGGLMQRTERVLLFGIGAIADPIAGRYYNTAPGSVLKIVTGLVAFGAYATAIYRTVRTSTLLSKNAQPETINSVPAPLVTEVIT